MRSVTGRAVSGVVPQVTIGATVAASSAISRSNRAPGSLGRARQSATARSNAAPCGARGRPASQAKVVSSGATMPVRLPASIAMLHRVIRASIDSARTAGPANSIAWPTAPAAPIRAMIARIRSLAETCGPGRPAMVIRICFGRRCHNVWVASTCATSEAPMPNASAPSAPCVAVCESPQTRVRPGRVMPCSGPTTCTMPWRGSSIPIRSKRCRAALADRSAISPAASGSATGRVRGWLGT